jgi:hypothetical protein
MGIRRRRFKAQGAGSSVAPATTTSHQQDGDGDEHGGQRSITPPLRRCWLLLTHQGGFQKEKKAEALQ